MDKRINVEFGKCSFKKDEITLDYDKDSEGASEDEAIRTGSLYFDKHSADSKHTPFMLVPYAIDMEKIVYKIFYEWNLPHPRIIILAVGDIEDSASDEYRKLSRTVVKGLVHALNTTEMWLCTDGLNHGFSRDVGKAYENEMSRRSTIESSMQKTNSAFPETALIGICRREDLTFSEKIRPKQSKEEIEKNDNEHIKRDINRRYGYFIFIEDTSESKTGVSYFLLNFAGHMSRSKEYKHVDKFKKVEKETETPVIALLLHGKITQLDLILGHLKLGLPLVVFEGSGGLADLIAYAYHQFTYCPEGINIAEYTEAVLKPQVSSMLHSLYPDFSDFKLSFLTEKIFDCVTYSKLYDQEFITILDIADVNVSSSSLPCYFLKALFKSQASDVAEDVKQQKKDLFLAMDWNSADVAREKVFARDASKFEIDNESFFRALTKPQREDFVSLFLSEGFVIHSFLDSSNLLNLFRNSLNREFFKNVVWENVLGFGESSDISRSFLDSSLIILIEELTGIPSILNSYELDWNCRAIYDDRTPNEAERKAVAVLALWAILSYRVQLVKTIWRHSDQPIHLALACSIILKKLEKDVPDLSVKHEMEKQSKIFSEMAAGVMTLCYENVPCRAIDLLNEKNRVWSYKALMELAAFSKNKMFLAHASCQKCLDNLFMGYIKIRDLPYGDITIPLWLKIILSAFLIFPMFLWVRFEKPVKNESSKKSLKEGKSDDQSEQASNILRDEPPNVPFYKKMYYFWSAPITKFWVCQVFYVLFLVCFSFAVIWPACGNVFLDFFTCVWLAAIIIDSIYHAYTLNMKYTSMPLVYKCLEISLMILFLFLYIMGRIAFKYKFMSPYTAKVILCIALIYFYYRIIFISLPISSELGPMLYRVTRMITVDFSSYIRVTILVIISNGIVIHAIVYPDFPLSLELIRRAFYDAIISFFLTPADHFGIPDPKCIRLKRDPDRLSFIGTPSNVCKVGRYLKHDCPNPGVWPYLFGLQYLMLLRMILVVMLFALFSNTTKKLEEEGKYIWKYQRYELVINFSNRLTLPPPLSIITLIFMLFKYLFYCSCSYLNRYVLKYYKIKGFKRKVKKIKPEKLHENDFTYWKNLAMLYYKETKQEEAREMTTLKRMKHTDGLSKEHNIQRRSMRNLEGNLNELQLQIENAHQYLKGAGLQASVRERLEAKNIPQIFSRVSPYPNTMVTRFPVSDNHVSWKCIWTAYDPISFTLPKEDFPAAQRSYIDVDIQRKREIERESFRMPNFTWNKISVSPGGVSFDRQSWIIDKSGQIFQYGLDSEDLPKNPLGRTGLKGRGCLPRWGPNHYIYVVITQWHKQEEFLFQKYLDVILVPKNDEFSLPGGYVYTENRYEIIQSLFETEARFKESDDMVAFFQSLGKVEKKDRKKPLREESKEQSKEESGFKSEKVRIGYVDEQTNTDQAWCEAEVWHFHYNTKTDVKEKFKGEVQWQWLREDILEKVPLGQASLMHLVANNMESMLNVI